MSVSKIVMRIVSISFSVLMFILVVYILYQAGLKSYHYGYRVFTEPAVSSGEGRDKLVQITAAMDASDIGELLEEKGLIRDRWLFFIQLKLSGYDKKIKADRYTLNTSMTAREMMQIMSGESSGNEDNEEDTKSGEKKDAGEDTSAQE